MSGPSHEHASRSDGATADSAPPVVHDALRSPGRPLEPATRSAAERQLGHDFGDVRVHTGELADSSAHSIGAVAYAHGSHVVFGADRYRPDTSEGFQLLSHELAHVIQQHGSGRGSQEGLEVGASDDAFERAADVAGGVPGLAQFEPAPASLAGNLVQRQAAAAAPAAAAARAAAPAEWAGLRLTATATAGMVALRQQVPGLRIRCGARTRAEEAAAWAGNLASNRNWVSTLHTYTRNLPEIRAFQTWLDANWSSGARVAGNEAAIAARLEQAFAGLSDAQMGAISQHFNGNAVDLVLDPAITQAILLALPRVRADQVFLEGNHWHVGFE